MATIADINIPTRVVGGADPVADVNTTVLKIRELIVAINAGLQGLAGIQGPAGVAGPTGSTGPAGVQGPAGTDIATVVYDGTNTSAPRPVVTTVFWVGFPIQPTYMTAADLWEDGNARGVKSYLDPVNAIAVTFDRMSTALFASQVPVSGTLTMTAIVLFAGDVLTTINLRTGSSGWAGVTHSWASIFDANRVCVATSADDVTASQAISVTKGFALAAPYTVPTTGLYYIGTMVAATTIGIVGPSMNLQQTVIPPILHGQSNTGMTMPLAVGAIASNISAGNVPHYCWLT